LMSVKRRIALALALGTLASVLVASSALATHPRPLGASKIRVTLVPAFRVCGAGGGTPNSTHGAPLSFPSCTGSAFRLESNTLTVPSGTPPTNASGSITIEVYCTNGDAPPCSATAGDQQDVRLIAAGKDIRCRPNIFTEIPTYPAGNCASSNGAQDTTVGKDYTGMVLGNAEIRITDHYNTAAAFTTTGTVTDTPFPVGTQCTANTGTDGSGNPLGGDCNITTSADAVIPGVVLEQKRASVEIGVPTPDVTPRGGIFVLDSGENGILVGGTIVSAGDSGRCPPACLGSGDEDRFSQQGIFIP